MWQEGTMPAPQNTENDTDLLHLIWSGHMVAAPRELVDERGLDPIQVDEEAIFQVGQSNG
jgi:hypothetical protein